MQKIKFLDLKKNYLSINEEIDEECKNIFNNCDFVLGKNVNTFENNFANYLGCKYFIGCANGTDALEIAIKCLELNKEDEVIVQSNTYIATCLGVLNNNITLKLCDIDENTHMIDINKLKKCINNKTKAIIVVHLYGLMPDMDEVVNICKLNDIYLIEDCAQAHGATYRDKKAGTFGDLSTFSFYPGKNLGAYGDGGGLATNNDIFNEKIRKYINLGCKIKYHHELLGRNSRLDTIQASFLNVKLKYLDKWNESRRKNADLYKTMLIDNNNIQLPKHDINCIPVYHLYVIKTKYRDRLKEYLEKCNIETLIHYPISVAETDALKEYNFDKEDYYYSMKNSNEILSLPMYPELSQDDILYVCNKINSFFLENNLVKLEDKETENKPGIIHFLNNLSFDTKRVFYMDNFDNINEGFNKRGMHANINFDEILFLIDGSIKLSLTDNNKNVEEKILTKNEIHYISRIKWIEFEILEKDTIILVLANEILEKSKSIYDFDSLLN